MSRIPSLRSIARLPQTSETWQVAIAQLRTWIAPEHETPRQPYAIFIFCNDDGGMLCLDISEYQPTPEQVRDTLLKTMAKPVREAGPPRRPATLVVPEPEQAEAILTTLAKAGVEIDLYEAPPPPEFQDIVRELESHLRGGEPEHSGLLSVKGVTPELAGSVFAAAAEFYRAAPWVQLNNMQVLAIRHPAEPKPRFVSVMGNGGVEYGLATYLTWADVERMMGGAIDDPMEAIPESGAHSLFFDTIDRMAFDDLEALKQYGWEVAGEAAYPIPVIYDRQAGARRPELIDMLWYEAALCAIPIFVREHLRPDHKGDYLPAEAAIEVRTSSGPVKVDVKYPAGTLAVENWPAQDADWPSLDEEDDDLEDVPAFDRRGMEGMLAKLVGQIEGGFGSGDPNLDKAQQLMYKAWDETNPAKRIGLAHKALSISPDCADAYVLLAEEEADTVARALALYEKGVAAGERALGPEYFREFAGDFWGLLETRPYMRAREGLARMLWQLNRREEAAEHYRDLLRLNPNDNQGLRYLLMDLYLQLDQDANALKLYQKYHDDWSAVWQYSHALLEFRKSGSGGKARKALDQALEQNSHVPDYLTGKKRIPNRKPGLIGVGDQNEAVYYASQHLNHWRRTPGAVEWLVEHLKNGAASTRQRTAGSHKKAPGQARPKRKSGSKGGSKARRKR